MSSSPYTVLGVRKSFTPISCWGGTSYCSSRWPSHRSILRCGGAWNILPALFVALLVGTYRMFPLPNASYILITIWLTLHTIAAHYTYPKVSFGFWLDQWFIFIIITLTASSSANRSDFKHGENWSRPAS